MADDEEAPVRYTGPMKRRATLVCLRCHEKKIKCDIQSNKGEGECSNCKASGSECNLRVSRRKNAGRNLNRALMHSQSYAVHTRSHPGPLSPTSLEEHNGRHRSDDDTSYGLLNSYPPQDGDTPTITAESSSSRSNVPNDSPGEERNVRKSEKAYLGRSGFLPIFDQIRGREPEIYDTVTHRIDPKRFAISPMLQTSFTETYLEYCYVWCPLLSRKDLLENPLFSNSVLLQQSLAVLGTFVKPPLIKHASTAIYYDRAKMLFYGNYESTPLTRIIAVMLLYWYSAGPPNVVSMDSQFWWTGVAIRLGQEIGLHRDPSKDHTLQAGETLGLRRRIWWTLYARERLTAICQGRPTIIDADDCDVPEPTFDDFPPEESVQAEIFIQWVKLCTIIGRVGKYLIRRTEWAPVPLEHTNDLINWSQSLPNHLKFPFEKNRVESFDRHIHQLHLPYLVTITLLYMSTSAQPLPRAYTAGILAASCVARIMEDLLARGTLRFLPGMAGWYISVAILALLHARKVEILREAAEEHIEILFIALKEMGKLWYSSRMFIVGFDKIIGSNNFVSRVGQEHVNLPNVAAGNSTSDLTDLVTVDGVNYLDYFPGATIDTSPLFRILLTNDPPTIFSDMDFSNNLNAQLHDLFGYPTDNLVFDMPDL